MPIIEEFIKELDDEIYNLDQHLEKIPNTQIEPFDLTEPQPRKFYLPEKVSLISSDLDLTNKRLVINLVFIGLVCGLAGNTRAVQKEIQGLHIQFKQLERPSKATRDLSLFSLYGGC